MGSVYSGVGLVSGIDYETMISQLLAIEAQPRDRLIQRASGVDAERAALKDISARISAVVARLAQLKRPSFFNASKATSSNQDVLTVSGADGISPGAYQFRVQALATTHQLVSRGFASTNATVGTGTFTLESAAARAAADVSLESLNGYTGVQRGAFKLTDAAGTEATIDISSATTIQDVVDRINNADTNITADLTANGLTLTENTGGSIRIREVDGKNVAHDLGFGPGNTYDASGQLTGDTIQVLADATPINVVRDGLGVRTARAGGDFTVNGIEIELAGLVGNQTNVQRLNHGNGIGDGEIKITTHDADGVPTINTVDLTGVETMGEIKSRIEESVTDLTVTFADDRMLIGYRSNPDNDRVLKIEDVAGTVAADLNIATESETGRIDSTGLLPMDTVGDFLAAINFADENDGSVTAQIANGRLTISGGEYTEIAVVGNSQALFDLGFSEGSFDSQATGQRIIGGLDGVLLSTLNGGAGVNAGIVQVSVGDEELTVELDSVETIGGVVSALNAAFQDAGVDAEAALNSNGTNLLVTSFDGITPVRITDLEGDFAATFNLDAEPGQPVLKSDNLQRAYINEATYLDDLLNGRGVNAGSIQITNSLGIYREIDLASADTIGDVIRQINQESDLGITARVNDTGDGIILDDSTDGDLPLIIEDVSGHIARDLNLLGEHNTHTVDGSFETTINLGNGMTLQELADTLNQDNRLASVNILNDGTNVSPYRLQFTSKVGGSRGELLIDGIDVSVLTKAQDARIVLGDGDVGGLVLTSSTNQFNDIVPGLDVEIQSTSETPVTVNVSQDVEALVTEIQTLVEAYNGALDRISTLASFDPETEERGILLGDGTTRIVQRRLWNLINNSSESAVPGVRRVGDLGVSFSNGKLEFNAEEFRTAFAEDPEAVIEFFTAEDDGFAIRLEEELDEISEIGGLIDRRDDALEKQREDFTDRIETLNERLERSRQRMLREFQTMETVLAEMQSQQASISQLSSFSGGFTL